MAINKRYYRTVFLGVAALGVLVWAAVEQFGITWQEVGSLFLGAVLVVMVVVAAAALGALVWVSLRRRLNRDRRED
ncbi:MAG: hypothetical protein AAGA91_11910 [Pseudomonadota bacterium]